ncbi:hypothetical protein CPC08DRAFT_713676 [Agrocybe pediades]|nr:hypothetical protein CPC08DRAFT_713676 [Agrocybe pediades]
MALSVVLSPATASTIAPPRTNSHMCQAAYFNLFDDFCIWGPSEPESGVANTEGEIVAWCSKHGHGTRLIPQGALTGLQWIQTPDYVQAVGFIDQPSINIKANDWEERWTLTVPTFVVTPWVVSYTRTPSRHEAGH